MKNFPSKKLDFCLVVIIAIVVVASCKKGTIPAPPDPGPGNGGGVPVVVIPDTTIPAPGAKVRWTFQVASATAAAGTFKIGNVFSGKMLNTSVATSGTAISQLSQNGSDNHKWTLFLNANGSYTISNVFSGKVLAAKACIATTDTAVQVTPTGAACEQWQLVSLGANGYYRITNQSSGNSLSVLNASLEDNEATILSTYSGSESQQWQLQAIPTAIEQTAYTLITSSMNKAVKRYNKWGNFDKVVRVSYNPSVPTADANFAGNMRFGANPAHHGESTALHELAHCMGVGTSPRWSSPLVAGNTFVGTKALQWMKYYDGVNAIINCDNFHFWPYGINFSNEFSEVNADRHVRLVWAMKLDGL